MRYTSFALYGRHDAAAIHAVEQHLQRLNVSRPMELPPAVDSGLTSLTEEQETMVREAMAAGRATDVLSADCFTGVQQQAVLHHAPAI